MFYDMKKYLFRVVIVFSLVGMVVLEGRAEASEPEKPVPDLLRQAIEDYEAAHSETAG
jgi:hypothetical protein